MRLCDLVNNVPCNRALLSAHNRLAEIKATGYVEDVNKFSLVERIVGQTEADCKRSPSPAASQPTQLSAGYGSTIAASMSSWRQANVIDTLETATSPQRQHVPSAEDVEAASALQRHFDTAAAHFQCRLLRLQKQLEARELELKLALDRIDVRYTRLHTSA